MRYNSLNEGFVSKGTISYGRVQVDPGAVPADRYVAYPHFRSGQVPCGDHRNWHQDLVKITLQATGNLKERTPFLVSYGIRDNLTTTVRKTI